jgi:hypothetical protein
MPASLPKEVSADVLAALLGCTKRSINMLAEKKVLHRLQGGRFNLEDNVPLYIAHREQAATRAAGATGPYAEARAEATLERAKILRLQRQKIEGSLVSLAGVHASEAALATIVRTRFLAQGNALGARLANKSAAECCAILDKHNREILDELADLGNGPEGKTLCDRLHADGISMECDKCGSSHLIKFVEPRR